MIEYPPSLIAAWDALGTGATFGLSSIVDGALDVPSGLGLGVELDEAVATANPYRSPRRLAGVRVGTAGAAADSRRGLPDRFVGDR
jgi:hypothetical protein